MIDTRKKQPYQPAPLLAGHVSIDLEVRKTVLNIDVSRFIISLKFLKLLSILWLTHNNNNTKLIWFYVSKNPAQSKTHNTR